MNVDGTLKMANLPERNVANITLKSLLTCVSVNVIPERLLE